MFHFIKQIFIGLLIGLADASNQAKCVSLSNQKCMIHPTLINLHVLEVVILLMTCLINFVFQTKQKI